MLLKLIGMNPVVVHGGGPQIGALLQKIGKQSEFIQGMRVTDDETLDVVEMVLGGLVTRRSSPSSTRPAARRSGSPARTAPSSTRARCAQVRERRKDEVDIGLVGEIVRIDPEIIQLLDSRDFIPVIAPIGVGENGVAYNINADVVAGKLAVTLQAEKLDPAHQHHRRARQERQGRSPGSPRAR